MSRSKCKWWGLHNEFGWWGKMDVPRCRKHGQLLAGATCDTCPDYEPVSPESVDIVDSKGVHDEDNR